MIVSRSASCRLNSSTGGVTVDPAVSGQQVTWSGPFTVPGGGDLIFQFAVTVSSTPGRYTNSVTALSSTVTVAPAQNAAPIDVANEGPIPVVPVQGIPVALVTAAIVGLAGWLHARRRRTA
ncbi:MAG: hypothetical protein H0T70_01750 [Acidimicrobiia bacterium]|nr:hypothetical protein [Acidimicrobiia bacterium]